ncbi:MAG TPA: phosphoadenylyl-sulfate reductase [Terriglobales bacterium]|nr:phosphoadenylyl-sulfate reductase [Terriglobales bacterium]
MTATSVDYTKFTAEQLVASFLAESTQRACVTCSFQAEDMVVLDLVRQHRPDVAVLFLDTGYHFRETYAYRDRMTEELGLNLINLKADLSVAEQEAKHGRLYEVAPDYCCKIRKVEPLLRGLEPFDIWFTGLRREQSPSRANLPFVEYPTLPSGRHITKVNALAAWDWKSTWRRLEERKIPYLPLYDDGYSSIGCQPCTTVPLDPGNPRSGRWGGQKLECGIHTFDEAK